MKAFFIRAWHDRDLPVSKLLQGTRQVGWEELKSEVEGVVIGRASWIEPNLRGGTGKIGTLRAVRPIFWREEEKGISGLGSLMVNSPGLTIS